MDVAYKDMIYQKAVHYCDYQERTHAEVRKKLDTWGVRNQAMQLQIIQQLQIDRFLDEARYVASFIRGKLWGKKWGKQKLSAMLARKGLSPELIRQGLAMIDDDAYLQCLHQIATKKRNALQKIPQLTQLQVRQKLVNYLLQKGYEPALVAQTTVQEDVASH